MYKIKILKKGDRVIGVFENRIVVQRKNGEAIIFHISEDENGAPRIEEEKICLITFGKNEIESEIKKENKNIKITTF